MLLFPWQKKMNNKPYDQTTWILAHDTEEMRYHAENTLEGDDRVPVSSELLHAIADTIDEYENLVGFYKNLNSRLEEINWDLVGHCKRLIKIIKTCKPASSNKEIMKELLECEDILNGRKKELS